MSYVETEPSPRGTVAAIREKVLEGFAPVDDFAAAINKTVRTVSKYIASRAAGYVRRAHAIRARRSRARLVKIAKDARS